jgi:cytochrome c
MKKIAVIVFLSFVIASCGSKQEPYLGLSEAELLQQGEALIGQSDCMTCHHKINKIIGPSHTDVAKKYDFTKDNVDLLANRVITGSKGVWGDIAMTPHADLSPEDARKMVYYVLSLDGEKLH